MNTVYETRKTYDSNELSSQRRKKRRSLLLSKKSSSLKKPKTPSPKKVQFINENSLPLGDMTNSSKRPISPRAISPRAISPRSISPTPISPRAISPRDNCQRSLSSPTITIPREEKVMMKPSERSYLNDLRKLKNILTSIVNISTGLRFKNRSWRMRHWKSTFLAHQFVDWLIKNSLIKSRDEGVQIGNEFIKNGWIDHPAKVDEFRDTKDIFYLTKSAKLTRRELLIPVFLNIFNEDTGLELKDHQGLLKKHKDCFTGMEFVDFVLKTKITDERSRAVYIGKVLMEFGLIEHISQDCNFKDSPLLYQITNRGVLHLQRNSRFTLKRNKTELLQSDKRNLRISLERRSSDIGSSKNFGSSNFNIPEDESESSDSDCLVTHHEQDIPTKVMSPRERISEQFKTSFSQSKLSIKTQTNNMDVMSTSLQPELLNDKLHKLFLMEFCNAVANFKVSYLERSVQEQILEVDSILLKYFKQSYVGLKISSQIDTAFFDEIHCLKSGGMIQLDIFDKLLNQIISILNGQSTPTPLSARISQFIPRRVSSKRILKNNTNGNSDTIDQNLILSTRDRPVGVPEAIIVRRFSQNRGGVKVIVPGSLEKLLEMCSEKLKVRITCLREASTEAAIYDISLLTQDMILWGITEEEDKLFQ